jgi:hypothetical protein
MSPPLRRGSRADPSMQRYLIAIGAAWGGQTAGYRVDDLPRFALAKVALHFPRGLSDPSLWRGYIGTFRIHRPPGRTDWLNFTNLFDLEHRHRLAFRGERLPPGGDVILAV